MTDLNITSWQRINQARILIQQHNYQRAESLLHQALESDIQNADAMGLLALCAISKKDYNKAEEIINNALTLEPENAYLHYVKAHNYHRANNHSASLDAINEALALSPRSPLYLSLKAINETNLGNYHQANSTIETALTIAPTDDEILRVRAIISMHLGLNYMARDEIDKSLSYNPENSLTYTDKAAIYMKMDRPVEAIEVLQTALRLDPDNGRAKSFMLDALKQNVPVIGALIKTGFKRRVFKELPWYRYVLFFLILITSRGILLIAPIVWGIYYAFCGLCTIIFEGIISLSKYNRYLLPPKRFYLSRILFWLVTLDSIFIISGIYTPYNLLFKIALLLIFGILVAASSSRITNKIVRRNFILLGSALGLSCCVSLFMDSPYWFYLATPTCLSAYFLIFSFRKFD